MVCAGPKNSGKGRSLSGENRGPGKKGGEGLLAHLRKKGGAVLSGGEKWAMVVFPMGSEKNIHLYEGRRRAHSV